MLKQRASSWMRLQVYNAHSKKIGASNVNSVRVNHVQHMLIIFLMLTTFQPGFETNGLPYTSILGIIYVVSVEFFNHTYYVTREIEC